MASFVFSPALDLLARGGLDFSTGAFKVMLTTVSYSPNKDTHDRRDDVTDEVAGAGYAAGGAGVAVSVSLDLVNDRLDITLGGATWAASTLTARRAVYYRSHGGAASADELIAVIDFGADVVTAGGTFTLNPSTVRLTNT